MLKHFLLLSSLIVVMQAATAGHTVTDTMLVRQHLVALTKQNGYRNYEDTQALNKTAGYIRQVLLQHADTVYEQTYQVEGRTYRNVIASFGVRHAKRIIVGAHYDVCGKQEGADDNASGVAGLLELARQFKGRPLHKRIDLVAYTLEEPPFFRTKQMGSYVHAQSLKSMKADVVGMISLEMIGYFRDEPGSQQYPHPALKDQYGDKGDFISLVRLSRQDAFVDGFTQHFQAANTIRSVPFAAPAAVTGVDYSDHMNYWQMGISALMITDTSFFRNHHYHQAGDKLETLDITRLSKVVDGVLSAMLAMATG
ncbi:M28 family peptidase [Paraflavitalea pollutisoli]|uniref:M28 family peptidase n=1 Tax=Paraflavitalea pollutisoli TaxID=3034143 RepID=UPI0023EBA53E|nr:M28 family peptidase [Paraflavitalea sp. H1-2-19X]